MRTTTIIDISDYEENVLAGMNMRQVVLSVLGIIIIALSYMAANQSMDMQVASYLAIGGGLPCFLFAFARPHNMKLEEYIVLWVESNFSEHPIRYFEAENELYDELFDELPKSTLKLIRKQKKADAKKKGEAE